jgi:hypothetical protein
MPRRVKAISGAPPRRDAAPGEGDLRRAAAARGRGGR